MLIKEAQAEPLSLRQEARRRRAQRGVREDAEGHRGAGGRQATGGQRVSEVLGLMNSVV